MPLDTPRTRQIDQPRARPFDKLRAGPVGTRVWTAGRLLILVAALGITYGTFFLAALRVATRAREVKVPDVRGRSVTEASAALTNAGLSLKIDPLRRSDPKVPADHVLTQDPEPGTVLRRQRVVRIRVSEGQRDPVVPTVAGQAERTGETMLAQEQIAILATSEIRTSDYQANTIVAQSPPGKSRAAGVMLLINRPGGGLSYVMPDLIGTPSGRVIDVLRRQDFRVSVLGDVPYPGLPTGIVVRQTPQAGFQLVAGQPISLEVSR